MYKIQHEIWFTSLYIWMVIGSNPCNIHPLFEKKIADDLPQACGWQGQDKILACYNPFDTLPDSHRNSGNTEHSFWLQCEHSLLLLFGASPEPQITGHSDSGYSPDSKYVVYLPIAFSSPNSHRVCNKSIYMWWELMELLQILQVEGWKLLSSDASIEVPNQSCLWPNN